MHPVFSVLFGNRVGNRYNRHIRIDVRSARRAEPELRRATVCKTYRINRLPFPVYFCIHRGTVTVTDNLNIHSCRKHCLGQNRFIRRSSAAKIGIISQISETDSVAAFIPNQETRIGVVIVFFGNHANPKALRPISCQSSRNFETNDIIRAVAQNIADVHIDFIAFPIIIIPRRRNGNGCFVVRYDDVALIRNFMFGNLALFARIRPSRAYRLAYRKRIGGEIDDEHRYRSLLR